MKRYGQLQREHPHRELGFVHTSMDKLEFEERLWLGMRGLRALTFRHDLAFVTATLTYSGVSIEIPDVLVDTGAASTIIHADHAAEAGVYVSASDTNRSDLRSRRWTEIASLAMSSGESY